MRIPYGYWKNSAIPCMCVVDILIYDCNEYNEKLPGKVLAWLAWAWLVMHISCKQHDDMMRYWCAKHISIYVWSWQTIHTYKSMYIMYMSMRAGFKYAISIIKHTKGQYSRSCYLLAGPGCRCRHALGPKHITNILLKFFVLCSFTASTTPPAAWRVPCMLHVYIAEYLVLQAWCYWCHSIDVCMILRRADALVVLLNYSPPST